MEHNRPMREHVSGSVDSLRQSQLAKQRLARYWARFGLLLGYFASEIGRELLDRPGNPAASIFLVENVLCQGILPDLAQPFVTIITSHPRLRVLDIQYQRRDSVVLHLWINSGGVISA